MDRGAVCGARRYGTVAGGALVVGVGMGMLDGAGAAGASGGALLEGDASEGFVTRSGAGGLLVGPGFVGAGASAGALAGSTGKGTVSPGFSTRSFA